MSFKPSLKARAEASFGQFGKLNEEIEKYIQENTHSKVTEELARKYASLSEAVIPSPDTKAAYIGEFHFNIDVASETGEPYFQKVMVPWTTIKDIMKAIQKRAEENP